MKIFGPIIKAVIIGGGSIVGVYGTYWITKEFASANDGTDLTSYWTKIESAIKEVSLDRINEGLKVMNQPELKTLLSDKTKTKTIIDMMKDNTKKDIVINVAKGCIATKNAHSKSCKNIGDTLTFLSEKLSTASSGTGKSSLTWIENIIPSINVSDTLKKAAPEQLIKYLDTTQALEKGKKSLTGITFGLSDGLFDASVAFYTWLASEEINNPAVRSGSSTS